MSVLSCYKETKGSIPVQGTFTGDMNKFTPDRERAHPPNQQQQQQ